ncbi:FGFR1 oncogene partner 2 homolog [Neocloeon triangulifer]|uniref:FGFR1 oncogene partner 2 homolog n=1 Tax=Neocloeon triangulifer TaxID=2078957 RepID=UPI00286EB935|nr:FGFR1 oncogene partner 2 homolog [Neocloeon triangulifer]XP_059483105.1 FGFR1 oncogene partner 2 homolog [Neocloeon triangulifer]XP_059483106.1 FGFR1 oncogene partner 2 homolog [Neocloeon triangulifer]XP_059483107.1 FGFR1 oncogene partner 2 homolog [Neocloeon triangulifer]
MSITIQEILLDAKRLACRLKEHDSAADELLSQSQSVFRQIDAMKQYQEDLCDLSEVAGTRPQRALVASIQQENRQLRELQQENRELRALLEEHQNALELIMSKYRQHVSQLIRNSHVDFEKLTNSQLTQKTVDQADKISEMAAVMQHALKLDENDANRDEELVARLITENKNLRELVQISTQYGSLPEVDEDGKDS